jgi:4-carboxymuconolactone decarboxylase
MAVLRWLTVSDRSPPLHSAGTRFPKSDREEPVQRCRGWKNVRACVTRRERASESELFEKGLQVRREVLGADYVDANLADADGFMMAFQRVVTEFAWGYAWSNPGLDHRTRSILNLGLLSAPGRFQELGIYIKGALGSGVTVPEIRDALVHATVNCGTPAGRQAFLAAHEAQKAEGALDPFRRVTPEGGGHPVSRNRISRRPLTVLSECAAPGQFPGQSGFPDTTGASDTV